MKKEVLICLVILLAFHVSIASAKNCGGDVPCNCGDTLTSDHVMNYNMLNCSENGLTVNTSDIILDCTNHSISGDNKSINYGIHIKSGSNIYIRDCKIENFWYGIVLDEKYSENVELSNNRIAKNRGVGIIAYTGFIHILNNTISFNQVGISTYYFSNSVISANLIFNNSVTGIIRNIQYTNSSSNITYNNVYDNHINLFYYQLGVGGGEEYLPEDFVMNNNFFGADHNIVAYDDNEIFSIYKLENNWWGVNNNSEIVKKIFTTGDNVSFIPFLCEPYPTTWISDSEGNCFTCEDSDEDSICDNKDLCPNTEQQKNVDQNGCSNIQFCAKQPSCGPLCNLADWKNNEPLQDPKDCITVIVAKEGKLQPACAVLEGLTCGN